MNVCYQIHYSSQRFLHGKLNRLIFVRQGHDTSFRHLAKASGQVAYEQGEWSICHTIPFPKIIRVQVLTLLVAMSNLQCHGFSVSQVHSCKYIISCKSTKKIVILFDSCQLFTIICVFHCQDTHFSSFHTDTSSRCMRLLIWMFQS